MHDEIADLDTMIAALVDELAPDLISRKAIGDESAAQLLLTAGDNSERLNWKPALLPHALPVPFQHYPVKSLATGETEAMIALQTMLCISSLSEGFDLTHVPERTSPSA